MWYRPGAVIIERACARPPVVRKPGARLTMVARPSAWRRRSRAASGLPPLSGAAAPAGRPYLGPFRRDLALSAYFLLDSGGGRAESHFSRRKRLDACADPHDPRFTIAGTVVKEPGRAGASAALWPVRSERWPARQRRRLAGPVDREGQALPRVRRYRELGATES